MIQISWYSQLCVILSPWVTCFQPINYGDVERRIWLLWLGYLQKVVTSILIDDCCFCGLHTMMMQLAVLEKWGQNPARGHGGKEVLRPAPWEDWNVPGIHRGAWKLWLQIRQHTLSPWCQSCDKQWNRGPSWTISRLLTHRNCEIMCVVLVC